ncbi:uncharacterized protein LOC116178859 [Photinus pyralis]|uniref:uncharacterized protein LOC116178859 n=1 Tax=Photinus pyralis TaxID=7054 RepID=UPI001266F914|nr:uncharacterized protein LOC116178859 [Photinus pyralis]
MAHRGALWLSFVLVVNVAQSELNFLPSNFEGCTFRNDTEQGAVVMKSNLPLPAQAQLASALTSIYQATSEPMLRLSRFQMETTRLFPMHWNVVLNFANITFFDKYFIYLRHGNDRILAFGLN